MAMKYISTLKDLAIKKANEVFIIRDKNKKQMKSKNAIKIAEKLNLKKTK